MTAPTRSKIPESKRPFQHHLKVIKTQSQLELLLSAACVTPDYQSAIREEPRLYNSNDNTTYSCSSVRTFTFVMEPFKRFAKSYSEALWRFHFSKDRRNSDGSVKKVNAIVYCNEILFLLKFYELILHTCDEFRNLKIISF